MPDITALLERAAAEPTREPDIEGPYRRARRTRVLIAATALVVMVATPTLFFIATRSTRSHVVVTVPPPSPTTVPVVANPLHDLRNRFDIDVAPGYVVSTGALAPWLSSPHDILSVATVPLAPLDIPAGTNGAACPSEVPKVVADGIGPSGAYLSIREWYPGVGIYQAEPRPAHAADLQWAQGCALPDGMTVWVATFRDGQRDFTATIVLGRDAAGERATIYDMLDTFRPDQ